MMSTWPAVSKFKAVEFAGDDLFTRTFALGNSFCKRLKATQVP